MKIFKRCKICDKILWNLLSLNYYEIGYDSHEKCWKKKAIEQFMNIGRNPRDVFKENETRY